MKLISFDNFKKKDKIMKIFLGGTCNESTWRDELIPMLEKNGIDYFNPIVKDWTPECQDEELKQREICDYCLYTITPKMTGVYSIAEAVDDSNKKPDRTLFCYIDEKNEEYSEAQLKSLKMVSKMVHKNGGTCFMSLNGVVDYIKSQMDK